MKVDTMGMDSIYASLDDGQKLSVGKLYHPQYSRYFQMRESGESHNMAIMLATNSFPNLKTDATFLKGLQAGDQFGDCHQLANGYAELAKQNGFNPAGKVYLSQLARFPGDPEAWVSGRGDVERVCVERGYTCNGAVNYTPAVEREPKPDILISPDIVNREVDEIMAQDGGFRREDVYEEVYNLRAGLVDPSPPVLVDEPDDEYIDFSQ